MPQDLFVGDVTSLMCKAHIMLERFFLLTGTANLKLPNLSGSRDAQKKEPTE